MRKIFKTIAFCIFLAVPLKLFASPIYEYNSVDNIVYKYPDGDRSIVMPLDLNTGEYFLWDWGETQLTYSPDSDYMLTTQFSSETEWEGTIRVIRMTSDGDSYSAEIIAETQFGPMPYAYAIIPEGGDFFAIAGLMGGGWRFHNLKTGAFHCYFGGDGMNSDFKVLKSHNAIAILCDDVEILNLSNGEIIKKLRYEGGLNITADDTETYLAFDTKDSSYNYIIKIINIDTGKEVTTLPTPNYKGYGTGLLFVDETHLLVTEENGIHCYDILTQKQKFVLPRSVTGETGSTYMFIAKDGSIVTCTGNEVCTWDANTGIMKSCRVIEEP